jgi:hypothetical protein
VPDEKVELTELELELLELLEALSGAGHRFKFGIR